MTSRPWLLPSGTCTEPIGLPAGVSSSRKTGEVTPKLGSASTLLKTSG